MATARILSTWLWLCRAAATYRYAFHRRPVLVGALTVLALLVIFTLAAAAPAYADDGWGADAVVDSAGVPIERYVLLPMDPGRDIIKTQVMFMIQALWGWALSLFADLMRTVHTVLSLEWVAWLAKPLVGIVAGMQTLITMLGLPGILLTVGSVIIALGFARGKIAQSIVEVFVVATVFALLTGILSNPALWLLGPDGTSGMLDDVLDWSVQMANGILTGDAESSLSLDQVITAPMVDIFTRIPYQHVAFGHVLSSECQEVLNEVLPTARDTAQVRDAITGCDEAAGENMRQVDMMVFGLIVNTIITRFSISAPIWILQLLLVLAVASSILASVKLVIGLLQALLPHAKRAAAMALASLFMSLLQVVAMIIAMTIYQQLVIEVYDSASAVIPYATLMLLLPMLYLVLVILLVSQYVALRRAGKRLGEVFSRFGLTSGKPVQLRTSNAAANAARYAMQAASLAASIYSTRTAAMSQNEVADTLRSAGQSRSTTIFDSRPEGGGLSRPTSPQPALPPVAAKAEAVPGGGLLPSTLTQPASVQDATPTLDLASRIERPQQTPQKSSTGLQMAKAAATAGKVISVGVQVGAAAASGGTSAVASVVGKQAIAWGGKQASSMLLHKVGGQGRTLKVDGSGRAQLTGPVRIAPSDIPRAGRQPGQRRLSEQALKQLLEQR